MHWHGLFTPPDADGAIEEGTPPIAAGSSARYTFTPRPAGFRSAPSILVPLVFEPKFRGHGAMEAWTINGDSYPYAKAAPLVQASATACSSSTRARTTIRCICIAIASSCALSACLCRGPAGRRRRISEGS